MNILGLSAHFHDAAAALVVDGRLVAAAAEERFSRQKHDPSFPRYAAERCLLRAGLTAHDLDHVVFYEQPHVKFTRVLTSTLAGFPHTRRAFVGAMHRWLGQRLFQRNEISRELDVHPRSVGFAEHHRSHAAYAFLSSPFDEAAVLTVDAVGEWVCTALYHGRRGEAEPLRLVDSIEYPHSLGLVYAAFTAFLGFRPNSDECSTMALASFGTPRFADEVRRIIRGQADGTYEIDASWFELLEVDRLPLGPKFLSAFGPPAAAGQFGDLDAMAPPSALPEATQRYVDVAASLQLVLEETLLGLAQRAHALTGSSALCFAGGVALNCVANARLAADGPFQTLYVPPDPGDGGGSVGAALLAALAAGDPIEAASARTPYVGAEYDPGPVLEMLDHLGTESFQPGGPGVAATRAPARIEVERFPDDAQLRERVVGLLRAGGIVGWVQGQFEMGPRALGNRSLLLDPGAVDTARRMSRTVKWRAPFRPYAAAVAAESASALLGVDAPTHLHRWMQTVSAISPDHLPALRAAAHTDGTTRPQVCAEADNPAFHALLRDYGAAAGRAALLNTSLNERGAPMVASPADALAMFARTDMDALALGNAMVRKVW